ncbi:MAG TPA: GNAT family N-acetyltransferase [Gaiellaceae bacterium]|nr:GNAT family N-acetyltransferase [Gaiellaceae bacterium]
MPSAADVLALEAVAYELWLAQEVEELDGWRLRFAHGFTGRANSVWPNADGRLELAGKIERVEAWYRERGVPPMFQLTAAARPGGLDAALAARGYVLRGEPVSVQTAPLRGIAARATGDAEVSETLDDTWVELWTGSRGFDRVDVARALLQAGRSAFARVREVAVGRGVAVDRWLGITSMTTLPEARRCGHGRAILGALARWGRAQGCTRALLQVEHGNVPAERLYASAGFVASHDYHYRLLR